MCSANAAAATTKIVEWISISISSVNENETVVQCVCSWFVQIRDEQQWNRTATTMATAAEKSHTVF